VNDSLILVEFTNRGRNQGLSEEDAIMNAGKLRFRAIVLTTVTTFVGLLPLLFETSVQAQFVIPMALSLSFGILFASTITLILVPCLYLVIETNLRFVKIMLTLPLAAAVGYLLVILGLASLDVFKGFIAILLAASVFLLCAKMFNYLPEGEPSVASRH